MGQVVICEAEVVSIASVPSFALVQGFMLSAFITFMEESAASLAEVYFLMWLKFLNFLLTSAFVLVFVLRFLFLIISVLV